MTTSQLLGCVAELVGNTVHTLNVQKEKEKKARKSNKSHF